MASMFQKAIFALAFLNILIDLLLPIVGAVRVLSVIEINSTTNQIDLRIILLAP